MPTSRISAGILAGLQPGLQRGLSAGAMGSLAQQQGFNDGATLQSKLAQALATTRLSNAKADLAEQEATFSAPDVLQRTAMTAEGVPLAAAGDVGQYLDTGTLGAQYDALPADVAGPALPRPAWEAKLGSVAQRLAGLQAARAIGDKNSANLAKADDIRALSGLRGDIIAGRANRNTVGGAQAAIEGNALYGSDATGAVLDKFGGTLDTSNPLAGSTIALRGAQAKDEIASAAQHYASAGAAGALAEQRRTVTRAGTAGPGGKIPVGYRWAAGPDGEAHLEPIPGGPKDPKSQTGKPLPASAAKGYLENQSALRNVDTALALLEGKTVGDLKGDANATGMKGYLPDALLSRVDRSGVATRAIIADIGSLKLHDRSGAAVTAAETPRLKPFIPAATDPPDVVRRKLQGFRENYAAIAREQENFYRDSGYNLPAPRSAGAAAAPAAPAGANGFTIEKVED